MKREKQFILSTLLFFSLMLLLGCGGAKERNEKDLQDLEELMELVESREFEIENTWAIPLGGGRVNLIGNPNSITFKGDSVEVYLPYFGVRHSGGDYGGRDGGIKFEGPVENLVIREDKVKKNIFITFEQNREIENYEFLIRLYPNRNAYTSVNSSQRNSISYQGEVKELKKD